MSGIDEGVRLAKRVAALQSCSRSQAEALIAAGVVQVAGQTVTDPARRVRDEQVVQVLPLTFLELELLIQAVVVVVEALLGARAGQEEAVPVDL